MRHYKKFGRDSAHRKLMFRNMACSLFEHGQIKTTHPKAHELCIISNRLITLAKKDTCHNRRLLFQKLCNRDIVVKLFKDIGPALQSRIGGCVRVIKCGFRAGDATPMSIVQIVKEDH